jgi:hypothetical protein
LKRCAVAALVDAYKVINRPKAKTDRIIFSPFRISTGPSHVRTGDHSHKPWRLHVHSNRRHHPPFSPPQTITANEIQFNGSGRPANLHLLHAHRRSIARAMTRFGESQMYTENKERHGQALPALAAVMVAVVGVAGILYQDFGPANGSQLGGNAAKITAAAVSRAGAIQIPSQPHAGQSAS